MVEFFKYAVNYKMRLCSMQNLVMQTQCVIVKDLDYAGELLAHLSTDLVQVA